MGEQNLISCLNFIKNIVYNFGEYIDENYDTNETLESIESIKEIQIQISWTEAVLNDLVDEIKKVKTKCSGIIDPIISKVEFETEDNFIDESKNLINLDSFKSPSLNILYPPLQENIKSINWEEKQEHYDNLDQLVSVYINGYPGGLNNWKPLKRLLLNPYKYCIGDHKIKYNIQNNMKHIEKKERNNTSSTEESATEYTTKLDENISINHIEGIYEYIGEDGLKTNFPIIDYIENIPPSIYYFYGKDNIEKRGLYTRISNNTIVKIPNKINVIPEDSDNYKFATVKCIYETNSNEKCRKWNCTFAHSGIPYNKIGDFRKCPSVPRFSNTNTLKKDIITVNNEDIRKCMLYCVTDLFAINAWCQKSEHKIKNNIIIDDIELCGHYKNPYIDYNIIWEE